MLKSQLRHAYCALIIWLCFVQVLSLKVVHHVHVDHIVSVERSGSKAVRIDNSALAAHSISNHVEASTRFRKYGPAFNSDKVLVLVTALALWVVVAIACLAAQAEDMVWTGASDDVKSPRSAGGQQLSGEKAQTMLRQSSVMSDYNVMDTSPQVGVGSFAERYQQSTGRDREALELLLKCSVISQEEFYTDSVSLQHIEECISVAKVMLLQKSLDVWVELGPARGQQSFADYTVAAMISARGGEEDPSHPPETYVPQNRPPDSHACTPDSPQKNNGSMFSPGSIPDSYAPAVSLGSSVSFGVEEVGPFGQSGDGSPPKSLEDSDTDLPPLVPIYNVPPTIYPVTPQTTADGYSQQLLLSLPFTAVPDLNCYTQVDKAPVIDPPLMDAEWTQLQNTNPLPEKFPARRFSKVEDAARPSSNEVIQSNPSAQSLGGEGGGFLSVLPRPSGPPPASQETHYLLTRSSSGLVTQASPERTRLIPSPEGLPLTSPEDTPTYPTLPPREKLFSFEPQEVMAPPPEPSSPEEERALRTPPGSMSLPVAHRGGLPEGTVRRLTSASDLTPYHRSYV